MADSETCGEETLYNRYGSAPTATYGTQYGRGETISGPANGYQYYINIPGVYCFTAKGGDGNYGQSGNNGCKGATVAACYKLQKDDKITFRVGSAGATRPALTDSSNSCATFYGGGGGGGASWIYLTRNSTDTLLMVAGGGGGGGWDQTSGELCYGGSNTNSASNNSSGSSDCTDDGASAGATVNTSNFASLTSANGGDGGYHYERSGCDNKNCAHRYACGGGGGGYVGGSKGHYDIGGGGGGSYVNTSFASYDTSYATATMVSGSQNNSSVSAGSITVTNPKCLTCTECKYTTTYGACN